MTLQFTERTYDTNNFARHLFLPSPSFRPIRHSGASRPSNQLRHPEMKSMLVAFIVFIFIILIQGVPSAIEGAEADLTVPAVLRLRGK